MRKAALGTQSLEARYDTTSLLKNICSDGPLSALIDHVCFRPIAAIDTECDAMLLLTKSGHSGVAQYVMARSLVVAEAVRGACDEVIRL